MRFALALAVVVVVRVSAQSPTPLARCGFTLASPSGTTTSGPQELVGRLFVVPQPDSPVEITAIDLSMMTVTIAGSSYRVNRGSSYAVSLHNRSEQPVYEVEGIVGFRPAEQAGESGSGWNWKGTLLPGETVQTVVRGGGGTGSGGDADIVLSAVVHRVRFKECTYLPSRSYPAAAQK